MRYVKLLAVAVVAAGVLVCSVEAQTPSVPILVATSSSNGATLGIPRWKGYMSPTDPNKFWVCYANGGSSSSNISYTTDAGDTWTNDTISITGYVDEHLALSGFGNDLLFAFPNSVSNATGFRRFRAPAESVSDADDIVNLSGTDVRHRASIMVQNTGRIWVFTRRGGTTGENVRYQYSDDDGSTWTTGMAFPTNARDIRIGSMPYVNGNPALIVLHLNDSRGYEYYLWNGTSFEARADHSIYPINAGYDRSYTHNQINDSTMHLVFGEGANLRHVWKNYADGSGEWNTSIISTEANNGSIEWYPISTVRGNDMFVFYCRKSSGDNASSQVFYKSWSQINRTWGPEFQVSSQAYSRDPNTSFRVPANSSYIPVVWTSGTGPYSVSFSKVVVDVAPPANYSLSMASLPASGGTTVPMTGSSTHLEGTSVAIAASAAPGYTFASWTGDVENATAPITAILMNSNKSVTANFTELAVNDAPIVSDIPDQTVAEGETFLTVNLDDFVSDVDNLDSEISWSYSGNTELTVSIDINRVATITIPDVNWDGSETITFTATDPGLLTDSDSAMFRVTPVNNAPVLSDILDQTVAEGDILIIPVSAVDEDGDAMVLSTGPLPANAVFNDGGDGTGTLTFAPSYRQAGVIDIWFIVQDASMAADSELVQVTVTDTPQNVLWLATFHLAGETAGVAVTDAEIQLGVQLASQLTWNSPAPPEYTALLGLRDGDNDGPYFRDVREFGEDCYYWIVEIDPHGNVAPPATPRCADLTWDPAEFSPDHNYVLRDGLDPDGAILVADMRTTTQYQVCDIQTPHYITVHWESPVCSAQEYAFLNLTSGWNLISLPVTPASLALADLIPTAEIAFEFDGGYKQVTQLATCTGYWVRVPAGVTIGMVGTPLTDCTQALTAGWHLVGAPNCAATPQSTPAGALQALFGFDGTYLTATQIAAGGGYWASVDGDCSFELACALPSPPSASLVAGDGANDSRLVIRAERQGARGVSAAHVELGIGDSPVEIGSPPEAPEYSVKLNLYGSDWTGPFYSDIRTSDGPDNTWILAVNPNGNEGGNDTRTALLSWNTELLGQNLYTLYEGDGVSGAVVVADMSEIDSYEVSGGNRDQYFTVVRTALAAEALPSQYVLKQNYPNPFNPSTQIEFSLPGRAVARIQVFNINGQVVRDLLDRPMEAGPHTVVWNGTDNAGQMVASGVYLYRLTVDDFSQSRKMLLLK